MLARVGTRQKITCTMLIHRFTLLCRREETPLIRSTSCIVLPYIRVLLHTSTGFCFSWRFTLSKAVVGVTPRHGQHALQFEAESNRIAGCSIQLDEMLLCIQIHTRTSACAGAQQAQQQANQICAGQSSREEAAANIPSQRCSPS